MNSEERIHEVDLIEIFRLLWSKKYFITIIVTFSAVFSYFYAVSLVNYFQSDALLEVVDSSNETSASRLSGYASMIGMDIGDKEANKSDLVLATVKSKDFFKLISQDDLLYAKIVATKDFDMETNTLIFNKSIYDSSNNQWVKDRKPSFLTAFKKYKKIINIGISKDTGFITITAEHISPVFAKELIDVIIKEINILFRKKDLDESTRALKYLEEKIQNTYILEIKDLMNNLVSVNLEKQMMSDINKDYILSYIENAYIPENKSRPSKPLICILGTMAGFILSILIVIIRHYVFNKRSMETTPN